MIKLSSAWALHSGVRVEIAAVKTVEECGCCKEISVTFDKTKEPNVDCIFNHPRFVTVCLDEYDLEAAYYAYTQQYGNHEEIISEYVNNFWRNVLTLVMAPISGPFWESHKRYTAYRQLVRWCWGYLGREIGVALPSCAVDAIRQKFSSEGGNYTGFKHL